MVDGPECPDVFRAIQAMSDGSPGIIGTPGNTESITY
jgi:hypothetical protein